MDGVVKKKKKPLLAKIIGKVNGEAYSSEQRDIYHDATLNDISTSDDVANTIASRRDELRAARHGNTDAVVTFGGND